MQLSGVIYIEVYNGGADCSMCKGGDLNTIFPFRNFGSQTKLLKSAEALKTGKPKISIEQNQMNRKISREEKSIL